MDLVEQEPQHAILRTEANMKRRKRIFTAMSQQPIAQAREIALKRAKKVGVNIAVENAWYDGDDGMEGKVFGPCPRRDNIYQVLPQPNLHGMDEGLTQKTNLGVLEATIKEAKRLHNLDATKVDTRITALSPNVHYDVHYDVH